MTWQDKARRGAGVVARAALIVGCTVAGALAANVVGPHLWRGSATSFDMAFDRLGREWAVGGTVGAVVGLTLALSFGRAGFARRLGETALALGLLLALWLGTLLG